MSNLLVYLAGPITGLTWGESTDWREYVKNYISTLSPLRGKQRLREIAGNIPIMDSYEDHPLTTAKGINTRDYNDVKRADAIFVNFLGAKKVSIGTVMEILDEVVEEEWKYWEKYWINQIRSWGFSLVNHTCGGEGSTSGNITSFKKGQKPWNYGTAKIKVKNGFNPVCLVTAFKKGAIPWNKNKTGYYTSKKGTSVPHNVKIKISNTLKGRDSLKKKIVKQYDMNMNLIREFSSILEAKQITSIKGVGNVVTGRAKTAGGFIWQS